MAGLLSGIGSKVGGLLGDPKLKEAFWLTLASGSDPRQADYLREEKSMQGYREQQAEMARLQMEQAYRQAEEAQKRQAQEIISRTVVNHFAENPNAVAFGGPGATQQQQLAGLLGRGVDASVASGLISAGNGAELPADARLWEWAKGHPDREAFIQRNGQTQLPANIQEWQQYQGMTPEQKAEYLNMKRSGYGYDVGGVPQYRGAGGEVTPLATPEQVAANRGQQSAAQAAGTETGKAGVTAQMQLPQAVASGEQMYQHLEALKSHPGLSYAVGKSSVLPVIPGTPAADFKVRLDQVQGAQFLQAYETLKGGGQITEVEGKKAEAAIARMNRAQTEEEFKRSVEDFQSVVAAGVERAKAKANSGYAAPIPNSSPAQGNAEAERAALRAKHGL